MHCVLREGDAWKGDCFLSSSWPPQKGFMTEMADALSLTAAVKIVALGVFAEAEVALAVVVDGVDAEHEHVDELHVKNAVRKQRGVGGKAEMVHHALSSCKSVRYFNTPFFS